MLPLVLMLLGPITGPLEPIPPGLEDAVRAIDQTLPQNQGSTRDYVSDLLHLAKRGEGSALDRLRNVPGGVLCFWLDQLITFAEGATSDGAPLGSVVQGLHQLHAANCRGPGGKAAEAEHTRIFTLFTGALNDMRVAAAVQQALKGSPYQHLSPQAMHALPAGPPVPGYPNGRIILAVVIVALSAGVAAPAAGAVVAADGAVFTWPALVAVMTGG